MTRDEQRTEMAFESTVRKDVTRELSVDDWGRVMLEEVLLLGAETVSADGKARVVPDATVQLTFTISANRDSNAITVTTAGLVERAISVSVPVEHPA